MSAQADKILNDIAPFVDLGTDIPTFVEVDEGIVGRYYRNGIERTVSVSRSGQITEKFDDVVRTFANKRALLASPDYADLARWANSQKVLLESRKSQDTLPLIGRMDDQTEGGLELIDNALGDGRTGRAENTVLLLDGPAGIGKTSIIRLLAYERAANYRITQRPLILHVESRGRVLQNITDLMAFSLQTLRVPATYDQVPCLVRNGLITLAIDGFDELGDPNGYELAWAQMNDLITSVRGKGSILLAGRETFISRDRMSSALTAVRAEDKLNAFTIQPVRPYVAKQWLMQEGWTEALLSKPNISVLFDEDSYAMRPFFLRLLANPDIFGQLETDAVDDLLSFLIDAMVSREADKFGLEVESATTKQQRIDFVHALMQEVARDLAENQTDSIPADGLSWLSDVVASNQMPNGVLAILRHRVDVIAFLTNSDRRGYRRFIHEQVQNYFLGHVTISAIVAGELPKYLRRNILGVDFLEAFAEVIRHLGDTRVDEFVAGALKQFEQSGAHDRSRRNLAALIMATHSVSGSSQQIELSDVSMDEAYLTESVGPMLLTRVVIAQLSARSADMTHVHFKDCAIVSLIGDDATVPGTETPTPTILSLEGMTLTNVRDVNQWMYARYTSANRKRYTKDSDGDRQTPYFDLFERLLRYKPYWIADDQTRASRRILGDERWPTLLGLLEKHSMITSRDDLGVGGPKRVFYHLRDRTGLLEGRERDPEGISAFYNDLINLELFSNFRQ